MAEVDVRADRKPHSIAGAFQNVGEKVVVDKIGLKPQGEVGPEVQVRTAAKAIECSPIGLLARRRQLVNNPGSDGVSRMGRSYFVNCADGGTDEESGTPEVTYSSCGPAANVWVVAPVRIRS